MLQCCVTSQKYWRRRLRLSGPVKIELLKDAVLINHHTLLVGSSHTYNSNLAVRISFQLKTLKFKLKPKKKLTEC